jgi:hypothetical protein
LNDSLLDFKFNNFNNHIKKYTFKRAKGKIEPFIFSMFLSAPNKPFAPSYQPLAPLNSEGESCKILV